jgi:hypothetical protein
MLEETEVLERYKFWLDSVAELFGGLDILALEVVVSKDGIEHIIGVNDSALSLLGNQQEEDRKHIFDLIVERLEVPIEPWCRGFLLSYSTSRPLLGRLPF